MHQRHDCRNYSAFQHKLGVFNDCLCLPEAQGKPKLQLQAAQDRQARGVKRSADLILQDEEERQYREQAGAGQQPAVSGLTESYTADGNDDGPLADEDDMEEEIMGKSCDCLGMTDLGWHVRFDCIMHASSKQSCKLCPFVLVFIHRNMTRSRLDHESRMDNVRTCDQDLFTNEAQCSRACFTMESGRLLDTEPICMWWNWRVYWVLFIHISSTLDLDHGTLLL